MDKPETFLGLQHTKGAGVRALLRQKTRKPLPSRISLQAGLPAPGPRRQETGFGVIGQWLWAQGGPCSLY